MDVHSFCRICKISIWIFIPFAEPGWIQFSLVCTRDRDGGFAEAPLNWGFGSGNWGTDIPKCIQRSDTFSTWGIMVCLVWATCYNDGWWFLPSCPPALGQLQPACAFLCPWGLWEDAEKCISLFKLQPSTERDCAFVCAMLSTKRAQSWGLVLGAAATTGTTTGGSKQ